MKVAVSWSGGKDSCLACWHAMQQGHEVIYLLNMVYRDIHRVTFHGTRAHILKRQAEAMGIPLAQFVVPTDLALYEGRFKRALALLKRRGVEGVVYGDIYLQEHKDWVDRVSAERGLASLLPLWGQDTRHVVDSFIGTGFKSIVVSVNGDLLGEEWLGRTIDRAFVADLERLAPERKIDVCGEHGEFHSLVIDGPLFHQRMEVTQGTRVRKNGYWLLDTPRCKLKPKR